MSGPCSRSSSPGRPGQPSCPRLRGPGPGADGLGPGVAGGPVRGRLPGGAGRRARLGLPGGRLHRGRPRRAGPADDPVRQRGPTPWSSPRASRPSSTPARPWPPAPPSARGSCSATRRRGRRPCRPRGGDPPAERPADRQPGHPLGGGGVGQGAAPGHQGPAGRDVHPARAPGAGLGRAESPPGLLPGGQPVHSGHPAGEDIQRRCDVVVTHDRELVIRAAEPLLRRLVPPHRPPGLSELGKYESLRPCHG
jgi:hypothetical protein